ncbi:MAG: hypothetical protein NTV43_00685 [Methylococcales bacterium]|nr:hypothetical protein [Methylococcales bacterium]
MNKPTVKNSWLSTANILPISLSMGLISLLVSYSVEILLKEFFRLG